MNPHRWKWWNSWHTASTLHPLILPGIGVIYSLNGRIEANMLSLQIINIMVIRYKNLYTEDIVRHKNKKEKQKKGYHYNINFLRIFSILASSHPIDNKYAFAPPYLTSRYALTFSVNPGGVFVYSSSKPMSVISFINGSSSGRNSVSDLE